MIPGHSSVDNSREKRSGGIAADTLAVLHNMLTRDQA
jgi:hypothetical protein